jgi:hypothetical protein
MRARRQQGQTAVEVILTLPVVLLLVLGAIQYALILQARQMVGVAAWRGARAAAVGADYGGWRGWDLLPRIHLAAVAARSQQPPPPAVEARLRRSLEALGAAPDPRLTDDIVARLGYTMDPQNLTVELTRVVEKGPFGELSPAARVRVEFRFPLVLPVVGVVFDGSDGVHDQKMLMSAEATAPVEPS